MKWKNRAMGLALAGCMALSVLPAVSFAADMGTVTQSELNYADSGTCGENLAWTLDEEGTLTISGTGAMYNWDDDNEAPWYEVRKQIKTVAIENGVTTIGERAFFICENLASVTIPNSVTSIGSGAFVECFHLTSVTIPDSVTSIGSSAFDGCFGLESVTLGSRLTDIPAGMFYQCSSLKSIVIPDSVISIGKAAFLECSQLESVTLGTHVTNIGSNAFYFCDDLKRIAIPDSVTSIGERAFFACSSLEHVTIGSHVTTIGRQAFEYCSSVNEIYFRGNAPEMEVYQYIEDDDAEGSFVNVTATAYYPEHATGWEDVIQKDYTGPNGKLTWVAYTPDSTTTPVYEVFSDVPANAWYTAHVQYVYDNGLMSGSSTTTFEPNSPLTRAMVVQM